MEGFYPGVAGATSLARTLYGELNRWSKMPYTILGQRFVNESDFFDMNMTSGTGDGPGRTYKYYTGNATVAPFGYGLSYTSFSLSGARLSRESVVLGAAEVAAVAAGRREPGELRGGRAQLTATVTVSNTGDVAGDEVVFLFHNSSAAAAAAAANLRDPMALKQLVGFDRVSLGPGQQREVSFPVSLRSLSTVDRHGSRHTLAGTHELTFSRGHGPEMTLPVAVELPSSTRRVVLHGPLEL